LSLEKRHSKKKCISCHEHSANHRTVGPDLVGVYNRKAGSTPQGIHSRAAMESKIVWNDRNLDEYLASPSDKIPFALMSAHGVEDPQERADIIAYLKTLTR